MPTPDRTAIVTAPGVDLPPVGTRGRVVGGRGLRGAEEYCLRFAGFGEVWLRLPAGEIELPGGEGALTPPQYRYAMTRDPRWWVQLLTRLRLHRFLPRPDDRWVGRAVTVTSKRFGVPVGTVGTVTGYEVAALYRIRFPQYFDEIWTRLPTRGLSIGNATDDR